jgi:cold shock CspA family protein
MQALESPTVRAQTLQSTGTLIKWDPKRGWGLITAADGRRVYFAHYSKFIGECACGSYVHRCMIHLGMEVEFTFTPGAEHKGPFPAAHEIRIKERH